MSTASATSTSIQPSRLTYDPGGPPASFVASVVNTSDRFATFRIDVIAAGGAGSEHRHWYRLTPAISAKVPPGDRAQFGIEIVDEPIPYFAGDIDLTVRIFALELGTEERQLVRLSIGGTAILPIELALDVPSLKGYPGDRLDIVAQVNNPNSQAIAIEVQCQGLAADWLVDGNVRRIQIPPRKSGQAIFACEIPNSLQARSQIYPLSIVPVDFPDDFAVSGTLEVQPIGAVELSCQSPFQQAASPSDRRLDWVGEANFELELTNRSNLEERVSATVEYLTSSRFQSLSPGRALSRNKALISAPALSDNQFFSQFQAALSRFKLLPPAETRHTVKEELTVTPTEVELSGDNTNLMTVTIRRRRPSLGWTRRFRLEARGTLSDPRVELQPETQLLEVRVAPLIPFWAQLASLLALLLLALGVPKLLWRSPGHTGPVRTVRFNGAATELVSGSDDRSIRRWQIRGNRLVPLGVLAEVDKAVRVLRYRPIQNTWIAAGYENSSMQLWNLLSGRGRAIFAPKQNAMSHPDDRVFDLAFEPNSRVLLSGHGSGSVYRWQLRLGISDASLAVPTPELLWDSGFAIEAMTFAGRNRRFLAAAGQFNRLELWDSQTGVSIALPYQRGSSSDVITSLAVAESQPNLLAASDSQGSLSMWDLSLCATQTECQLVEAARWQGHGGLPVRSLSFSDDGCFLVSGGDDGRIVVWNIYRTGIQQVRVGSSRTLGRSRRGINSVDIARFRDRLLVASGGDNRRVRLHEYLLDRELQQQCDRS